MEFRWNDWNVDHATAHGVSPEEAEFVVVHARPPYPRRIDGDKWLAWGRGQGGRLLQVIFVEREAGYYIIHARPLTPREQRRYRRRKR